MTLKDKFQYTFRLFVGFLVGAGDFDCLWFLRIASRRSWSIFFKLFKYSSFISFSKIKNSKHAEKSKINSKISKPTFFLVSFEFFKIKFFSSKFFFSFQLPFQHSISFSCHYSIFWCCYNKCYRLKHCFKRKEIRLNMLKYLWWWFIFVLLLRIWKCSSSFIIIFFRTGCRMFYMNCMRSRHIRFRLLSQVHFIQISEKKSPEIFRTPRKFLRLRFKKNFMVFQGANPIPGEDCELGFLVGDILISNAILGSSWLN